MRRLPAFIPGGRSQLRVHLPRCGQRQVKLNGKVLCLNETCGAKWESRTEYDDELQTKEEEIHALWAKLKSESITIINRLPPDKLPEFAAFLAGWRQPSTERIPL